jgi:hypothetical protein
MTLLLNLERVVGGGFAYNLITLILRYLMEYGSSIVEYIVSKVVCFGSNGIVMFTNMHTSVGTQLRFKFALFIYYDALHDTLD